MYHPDGVVMQKVSNQEICQIFAYPTNCFSKMKEQDKQLLTDNDIPRKVVLDAIYFLDKFENTDGKIPAP